MRLIKYSIILCFSLSLHILVANPAQDHYRLIVSLENAPFDSLIAHDYTDRDLLFYGSKVSPSTWVFEIPDSIAEHSERLILTSYFYNPSDSSASSIRFISPFQEQQKVVNIGFQDRINYIQAVFKKRTVLEDIPIPVEPNRSDSTIQGKIILDDFVLTLPDDQSDIRVRAHDPYFAWFHFTNPDSDRTYEAYIADYTNMAEQFPDSRYLIMSLSDNLLNFQSKKDVRQIYTRLSPRFHQSRWAKKIEIFLDEKIQNPSLMNKTTGLLESVIQDTSRHNMIIFSASWCAPCIEEIPILTQIYHDLSEHLIMTYISLDREADIPAFQKLLADHQIPWRTLYAHPNIQGVQDQFTVEFIPHVILVDPDGSYQFVDVRKEVDLKQIYNVNLMIGKN